MKRYSLNPSVVMKQSENFVLVMNIEDDDIYRFTGDAGAMLLILREAGNSGLTMEELSSKLVSQSPAFASNPDKVATLEDALLTCKDLKLI
jgi:hypothetical protein